MTERLIPALLPSLMGIIFILFDTYIYMNFPNRRILLPYFSYLGILLILLGFAVYFGWKKETTTK